MEKPRKRNSMSVPSLICSFNNQKHGIMHKKIILNVFAKAEKESGLKTKTQIATYIANELEKHHNITISDRAIRNHYNDAKSNTIRHQMSPYIIDALCQYLGFENLKEYTLKNEKRSIKSGWSKNKGKVAMGSLLIVASYLGVETFDKDCMTWVNNHYQKENCDKANTIPLDNSLINNFKKVVPDSNYPFFKENGQANLWYGKSINGNYEYFTSFGLHPNTGKTLKAITPYIIKTHILNNKK
jgi:hypothetical protein